MTTKEKAVNNFNYDFYEEDSNVEELTAQELKNRDLELAREISKKECIDNSINVSLIAFNNLKSIGFKNDLSTLVLSKLIEEVYHERNEWDSSDYFDLRKADNAHYKLLLDYYKIGDERFYRIMIARAIGESECNTKNINDIVFGVVEDVTKKINNITLKLEA